MGRASRRRPRSTRAHRPGDRLMLLRAWRGAAACAASHRWRVVLVLERSHALTLRPRLRSLRYGRQHRQPGLPQARRTALHRRRAGAVADPHPKRQRGRLRRVTSPVSSDGPAVSGTRATVASSARLLCVHARGTTPWRDASFDHTSAGSGSRAAWGRVVADTAVLSRAGQRGGRRTSPSSTPSVPHASCARCDGDRTAGCHVSPARCSRTAWASA